MSEQTPPGYYDDGTGTGTQRWWDGGQWTEYTEASFSQPASAVEQTAVQQPAVPVAAATWAAPVDTAKPKSSRNAWIAAGVASAVAIIAIIVAAGGNSTASSASNNTPSSGSTAPPVTVTATATVTVTSAAKAAQTTPPAAPTTPTAAASAVLFSGAGSGIKTFAPFTANGPWYLHYTFKCSDGSGNFVVTDNNSGDIYVNALAVKGSDSTYSSDTGQIELSVNSECSWTMKVVTAS